MDKLLIIFTGLGILALPLSHSLQSTSGTLCKVQMQFDGKLFVDHLIRSESTSKVQQCIWLCAADLSCESISASESGECYLYSARATDLKAAGAVTKPGLRYYVVMCSPVTGEFAAKEEKEKKKEDLKREEEEDIDA